MENQTIDSRYPSALEVNLERTAAKVAIPEEYTILLRVAEEHYGIFKQTEEFLIEINHPFVNWEFALQALKTISIGNFYVFNIHDKGEEALRVMLNIYLQIIERTPHTGTKELAARYLFEYLSTIMTKSDRFLSRNIPLFHHVFENLLRLAQEQGLLFKKLSGNMKALLRLFNEYHITVDTPAFRKFVNDVWRETYLYWLSQPDPSSWDIGITDTTGEYIRILSELTAPLSHIYIKDLLTETHKTIEAPLNTQEFIAHYIQLPDHSQIVDGYFLIADQFEKMDIFAERQHVLKLNFLFNMLTVEALADVYTNILIEINRSLGKVFKEKGIGNIADFIQRVFRMLKGLPSDRTSDNTIIDCITTIAQEVFAQNNHKLVDVFIDELISFGFQHPNIKGSTSEWQVKANPAHIMNIRSWLKIISMKPRWTKRLLSALIINLHLGGVFVKDTDLIQKDISNLLNSDTTPAYNLVKQLMRLFPVFFTEIGAEGELRAVSTKVDDITSRRDRLINFIRKQSHVESNSLLVGFIEAVFRFWYSGSKEHIQGYLPEEVFASIDEKGEFVNGMHEIFKTIFPKVDLNPEGFLLWEKQSLPKYVRNAQGVTETDKERAWLMIRLYQLLYKKYNLRHIDLLKDMELSGMFPLTKLTTLKKHLAKKNYYDSLVIVLDFLTMLKEKILSPVKTEYFENIYYKRHIAAGIPSMYGTYKEEKFEALGFTLRLESLATVLFEGLMTSLNLKFITKSTLFRINKYLWLYEKALELDGISIEALTEKTKYITSALKVRQFSIDQYVDIFTFIQKGIQDIIHDYYIDVHAHNLAVIVPQIMEKTQNGKGIDDRKSMEKSIAEHSERFFRSIISLGFGIQVLDNMINNITRTLDAELEKFKDNKHILNLVMGYIPELAISSIQRADKNTDNQILIGNKGYFLKLLASFGFPVPPGFIITTEVFRGYEAVVGYKYITKDLSHRIYNEIVKLEKITGLKYGNPVNPLLLSVRSGATISLPGMMSSFLNVGINEEIADGLSKKPNFAWAAWDSYRRFLQTWGMFQGLKRDLFDMIIDEYKERHSVARKIQFTPEQMRDIALAYKKIIAEQGIAIPEDPFKQLEQAILQVFASWNYERARLYRRQLHVSDEWGTAVIVQRMVFGNLNDNSGSGVIFTRDPKGQSSQVTLYGDFIFGVQGDDIVSGLVGTYPVSERQKVAEKRESSISLENTFPEIYQELLRLSERLIYEKGFNHQEIEFTFENPTRSGLYILQTREMGQRVAKRLKQFLQTDELHNSLLGIGIGVGGGALSGRVVYCEDDIEKYRQKESATPLILIRPDTVPDDVGIVLKVEGILTSKGGSTSHAAVTIPQLNKVGVVGFTKLKVYEEEGYSVINGTVIRAGDFISIDGSNGSVYMGRHEIIQE